jgi:hypothetical protein
VSTRAASAGGARSKHLSAAERRRLKKGKSQEDLAGEESKGDAHKGSKGEGGAQRPKSGGGEGANNLTKKQKEELKQQQIKQQQQQQQVSRHGCVCLLVSCFGRAWAQVRCA